MAPRAWSGRHICTLAVGKKPWLARRWLDLRRFYFRRTNQTQEATGQRFAMRLCCCRCRHPKFCPRGSPEAVPRHTGVIGSPSPVSQECLALVSEHSPGPAACLTSLVRTKSRTKNDAQRPSRLSFSCGANAQHLEDTKAPRPEPEFSCRHPTPSQSRFLCRG